MAPPHIDDYQPINVAPASPVAALEVFREAYPRWYHGDNSRVDQHEYQ